MLERSAISILYASNSPRGGGSWWRNHGWLRCKREWRRKGGEEILAKDSDAFFEGRSLHTGHFFPRYECAENIFVLCKLDCSKKMRRGEKSLNQNKRKERNGGRKLEWKKGERTLARLGRTYIVRVPAF